ncbi:hypothetical protein GZH53_17410 [Flavihumibacter sp. R14]|nr:hypothetical protein [Flavihumibacter soli]
MSYRHDIFVSYKWGGDRKRWVDQIFLPILRESLENVKGTINRDDIFHDVSQTLSGAYLPDVLKDGVAFSKCMVCIITLPYFVNSIWCPSEFAAMLKRETVLNIRANNPNHTGLIFPIVFVDEEETTIEEQSPVFRDVGMRNLILNISPLRLNLKYNSVSSGFKESLAYDELRTIVLRWVRKSIYPVVSQAPSWDPDWRSDSYFIPPFSYSASQNPMPLPTL